MSRISYKLVISRGLPYLINTLFDGVFTILGIVIGSAFGSVIETRAIVGTIITASISLGTSSGFSVYEAETLQEEKRIDKIEEALLTNLENTLITEDSRMVTILSLMLVFLTPLFACLITLIPFSLVYLNLLSVDKSIFLAVIVDLSLIFLSGIVLGGDKRLLKGIRMTVLGGLIFLFGFILNYWI